MCHICDALDASTARCVGSKSTEVTEVKGSFLNFNHEKMSLPLTLCKDNIKKKNDGASRGHAYEGNCTLLFCVECTGEERG